MPLSRREFLKLSSFAAAGTLTFPINPLWALQQSARERRGQAKRVVILGAGLAGLSAGWQLQSAGHDVTILEAQLHPGGRVHTIREGLSDGLYAEAGAGRIPNTHNLTLEWANHFGLSLEPFYPTKLAEVTLLKGKRVITPMGHPVDMARVPLDLTPTERKIGLSDFEEYYYGETMRRIGGGIRDDWPPDLARLADISMSDFLRGKGASPDAIHDMTFGFEGDAALDFMRDSFNHHTKTLSKIKGGNDLLPRAFAAKLSDSIRYGCAVEHIERGGDRVRITCRREGMIDHVEGDAAVCTIPYGVLRGISVAPDWAPEKRKVIDNLYYGPVVRTTFQVSRRYWEDEGLNGFGMSDKDFEVWSPTYGKPGRRGLLQAYVYEEYARELDEMNENDRIERMIGDMNEVHPGLREYVETVVVKSWATDPWQKGAFVVYHPHQQEWYAEVCKPDGNVWFAGEHASPWPGWMQGALASGMKAAQEINAAPPRSA
ncbi:MAG TPA: NAD(P)/FAD-dependent oxidoreductase [Verrucomicrobiae bacterium]|nr:NAD(P)/FAD-dependent oxidoreductase [Verrucomicrobiae bacterium]